MSLIIDDLHKEAISLLKELISIPSLSRKEEGTAELIYNWLDKKNLNPKRLKNNVYCKTGSKKANSKVILLNSHHDTVKPGIAWKTDPFASVLKGDKLTGLGSNDAGGSVVSLILAFAYLSTLDLPYRLVLAITAEEEISGKNGIRLLLPVLGNIDLGIVGEPTEMQPAIAERGLIVLDCVAKGETAHAAYNKGENALYKAIDDIRFFQNHPFKKESKMLGKTKMTVTQIESGTQHNVIPDQCHFVVDVRTNELYDNLEIIEKVKKHIQSEITPRSYHLNSSRIAQDHPIVQRWIEMGRKPFGSPTLSDQSVMNFPTIKIGPGKSARSHTPNEFIYLSEIREAIMLYIKALDEFGF